MGTPSMKRSPESPSPQGRGRGGVTAIRPYGESPRSLTSPLRAFARKHPTLDPSPEGREVPFMKRSPETLSLEGSEIISLARITHV
jgi:hypothetical protein